MNLTTISTMMTGNLTDFGDEVLIILTAVIGIAIAMFLFKWAWARIVGFGDTNLEQSVNRWETKHGKKWSGEDL